MLNLDKNKKYLLACSFGPDSMALFDMLLKAGYIFEVAHVNYHLRKESDYEELCLRNYCKEYDIKLHVFRNKKKIRNNVEAICREIRYDFFAKIYHKNKFDGLLIAHNEDDLIETYLLQKKRKNLVFCFGLSKENIIKGMRVLRPLLDVKKNELLNYCKENEIPYSIDKTNLLPIFERNKIRINVVSKMKEDDRQYVLYNICIENESLHKMIEKVKLCSDQIKELQQLTEIEFAYYLNIKLRNLEIYKPITYKQSIEVGKFLHSEKPNIFLKVAQNEACVYKAYDRLLIEKNEQSFEPFNIEKPCVIDNQVLFADLVKEGEKRNIKENDYPLTIRTYQAGDKTMISDYQVLVRRLFIDWKMPLYLRKRWPLFVNKDNKIVYIPRYRSDFQVSNSPNFYVKECFTLK
ncbi:MAG: tRNA lysidine(34) synthetase TilS [Bacilli bacterium]|nr:tRNA lysidine(34) synthetase TilS [Bacilli bacterium]